MTPQERELSLKGVDFVVSNESLNKMNSDLIRRWNARVKEDDVVFYVGDFCFKSTKLGKEGAPIKALDWIKQLNGHIIFIKGNHDKNNSLKTIVESLTIKYGSLRVNLVHNPERANTNFRINFTGHVHNNWEIKRFGITDCINVGVDVWNYYPVTFEEIMRRYSQWIKLNPK